jgi:hypothetical protein
MEPPYHVHKSPPLVLVLSLEIWLQILYAEFVVCVKAYKHGSDADHLRLYLANLT